MRGYRRFLDPMLEADDIDDFDVIDDFDDYDDEYEDDKYVDELEDELEDEYEEVELTEKQQTQLAVLEDVADNLDVDFTIKDDGLFSFNLSSRVSVAVDVLENPVQFTMDISDSEEIDCTSTTSDVSALCDSLTLAIMVIKEAKSKLRGV